MAKFAIHIGQHRFTIQGGQVEEELYKQSAAELAGTIENLRKQGGFPDSARATALAALLAIVEAKRGKPAETAAAAPKDDRINALVKQIETTLARTTVSSAKTTAQ